MSIHRNCQPESSSLGPIEKICKANSERFIWIPKSRSQERKTGDFISFYHGVVDTVFDLRRNQNMNGAQERWRDWIVDQLCVEQLVEHVLIIHVIISSLFFGFFGFFGASSRRLDLQHSFVRDQSECDCYRAEKNLTEPGARFETGSHVIMRRLGSRSFSFACDVMKNWEPPRIIRSKIIKEPKREGKWVKSYRGWSLNRDHFDASLDQNNGRRSGARKKKKHTAIGRGTNPLNGLEK